MTNDKKSELKRLLSEMRNDLYSELDKRLTVIESQLDSISEEIEKEFEHNNSMTEADIEDIKSAVVGKVSDDVEDFIMDEITEKLEGHISTEQAKSRKRIIEEIRNSRSTIRLKALIWGSAVVFGGWLTWYGAWGIIGTVPLVQEPYVALILGITLLTSTGVLHKKLVG